MKNIIDTLDVSHFIKKEKKKEFIFIVFIVFLLLLSLKLKDI